MPSLRNLARNYTIGLKLNILTCNGSGKILHNHVLLHAMWIYKADVSW
jgi:hypothetical protein